MLTEVMLLAPLTTSQRPCLRQQKVILRENLRVDGFLLFLALYGLNQTGSKVIPVTRHMLLSLPAHRNTLYVEWIVARRGLSF